MQFNLTLNVEVFSCFILLFQLGKVSVLLLTIELRDFDV